MTNKNEQQTWSDLLKHWEMLTPKDRTRLRELLVKSKGFPGNLTAKERTELKKIVGKTDPFEAGATVAVIVHRLFREGRLRLPKERPSLSKGRGK